MRKRFTREYDLETQSRLTILVVVIIGYLVTFLGAFSSDGFQGTWPETLVAVGLGVIYLGLNWYNDVFLARWGRPAFFLIQIGLLLAIHWLIGPGTLWLISLPLAAIAVQELSPVWRWSVYVSILLAIILPLGFRYGAWNVAVPFALSVSPAIFFVVVFTQLGQRERTARRHAEQLMTDLEAANRQLADYAVQAEEMATTQERNRLAREIHDNLGHYLTVVNVQIGAAKVLWRQEPERALVALDKAQSLTQEGLTAVRHSVAALRESPWEKRPLPEAIADLVRESNYAGIVTELVINGPERPLSPQETLTLYRVVQEGLTNVRKHARASRVDVQLDYSQPGQVCLCVVDNGLGAAKTATGFGLLGIQERVRLLQGEVKVETAVHQGFSLSVTIPTLTG
jgi:glucose-6-phosphate-specific signal transduction histidine kinase